MRGFILPFLLGSAMVSPAVADPIRGSVRAFQADGIVQAALAADPQPTPEATPTPTPPPPDANADPTKVSLSTGIEGSTNDETRGTTIPTVRIAVDSLVPWGAIGQLGRVEISAQIAGQTGRDVSLGVPATWRAAVVQGAFYRVVGQRDDLALAIIGTWQARFAIPSVDSTPQTRSVRRYAIGARMYHRRNGSFVQAGYGGAEDAGERGWGQILLSGRLVVPYSGQLLALYVDAVINAGPSRTDITQHDIISAGVETQVADVVAAVAKIFGKK